MIAHYRYFVDWGLSRAVEGNGMPTLKPAQEQLHGKGWGLF
jgi:hypothetical protein